MAISEHIEEFHGLPVFDFPGPEGTELPAPESVAWRVQVEYDGGSDFAAVWAEFLAGVAVEQVRALVIGPWWEEDYELVGPVIAALTGSATRLGGLRALFLGEVVYEECELSWLQLDDVTPLLESFPELEELVVRGASADYDGKGGLALRAVRHENLRALRFEAGGLPVAVVRAVGESDFPALESLELWLGVDEYGGDAGVADLAPVLSGERLPALRRLGLENSALQDELAKAAAESVVVGQLESLSLALGALTDAGAEALLGLTHLRRLDLHHHYLTDAMQQRLRDTLGAAGVELDLSDAEKPDDNWRYVANGE
ncbi:MULTISPECIES: STM4015 family protein [unclassified Kitasatospora]|uniref:STM4015 family protein n=1 Tax=unclassified Kitasatospora TaxID=2633591 RepID=UPI00071014E4|nr:MULTISPECIES: STM4015 family protein [unclassified Kitasatospora]KQV23745.1 cytoplasmic protein [Kitasatospora sp. Root107]KRB67542.1 cytoplasmic protein [Kitasatospora sp. Root187]